MMRNRKLTSVLLTAVLVLVVALGWFHWRASSVMAQYADPDPKANLEAQAPDNSLTVWLAVQRTGSGTTTPQDRVSIASGGKSGDAHKADVTITFDPPLSGGTEVKVSLIGGGEGFEPSSWWWSWLSSGRIRAKLDMSGSTYTYGQNSSPLSFTPNGSSLTGTVTSSNMVETTTLKVEVPSKNITLTCPIDFVVGDFTANLGEGLVHDPSNWTAFTVKKALGNHAIANHDVTLVVSKVYFANGTSLSASLGSQGSSTDLSQYVQLDGPALVTSYENVTTNSNGEATAYYSVQDNNVVKIEITACDMSVAENAQ